MFQYHDINQNNIQFKKTKTQNNTHTDTEDITKRPKRHEVVMPLTTKLSNAKEITQKSQLCVKLSLCMAQKDCLEIWRPL